MNRYWILFRWKLLSDDFANKLWNIGKENNYNNNKNVAGGNHRENGKTTAETRSNEEKKSYS